MLFSKFTFGSYVSSWTCEIRDGAETRDLITPGYFEEKQETFDFCRQLMVDGFEEHQLTLGFIRQLVLDCVYEAVQEETIEDNEIKGYF